MMAAATSAAMAATTKMRTTAAATEMRTATAREMRTAAPTKMRATEMRAATGVELRMRDRMAASMRSKTMSDRPVEGGRSMNRAVADRRSVAKAGRRAKPPGRAGMHGRRPLDTPHGANSAG